MQAAGEDPRYPILKKSLSALLQEVFMMGVLLYIQKRKMLKLM